MQSRLIRGFTMRASDFYSTQPNPCEMGRQESQGSYVFTQGSPSAASNYLCAV
jgi:hypothetical protein